jgi:hypothetical protein
MMGFRLCLCSVLVGDIIDNLSREGERLWDLLDV